MRSRQDEGHTAGRINFDVELLGRPLPLQPKRLTRPRVSPLNARLLEDARPALEAARAPGAGSTGVPLLLRYRAELGRAVWRVGMALIAIAAAVQVASVMFWLSLELYQITTLGHPTFVVWLRFKNIVAFVLNKREAWGLMNDDMLTDPWDYVHITTWNFLPFVLRRVGEAPAWVVRIAFAVWISSLGAMGWVLWRLKIVLAGESPTAGLTSFSGTKTGTP